MAYEPEPIDTSGVKLSEELLSLTELLARNTHDVWARQRMAEGWSYGPVRDDTQKQHPCLVPYEQLPESEKDYDRQTALETLRTIVKLGYRIEVPPPEPSRSAEAPEEEVQKVLERVAQPGLGLAAALALWQTRNPERWAHAPELYRLLGEQILKLGEPLIAYDVAAEGLEHWPRDPRLRQLQGLALARSGATGRAPGILETLRDEGHADEETLGILARTHKDLWATAADPAERTEHLRRAAAAYADAYERTGGSWTGINAASLATLLGERERAVALAHRVRSQCLQELGRLTASGGDLFWPLATLGEAALNRGEWSEAQEWYERASEVGRGKLGDLHSARRQARLLTEHLGIDGTWIQRCFRIPRVVVFAGHMVDQPDRPAPRFPPQLEEAVYEAIRDRLKSLDARLGYASAACGSDILFLEAILELGGEAHVVLPYGREEFKQDSVDIIPGVRWGERYEQVLGRAATILIASAQRLAVGTVTYDYANILLHGIASVRAQQLETELVPLAAWDGGSGDGPGGTASVVERWRSLEHRVEIVDVIDLLRSRFPDLARTAVAASPRSEPRAAEPPPAFPREIMAMLFADAVGFSKLREEEIPRFVDHFLGAIARLIAGSPHAPVVKNTWGDGLYFVFSNVRDAGQFALDLCDLVRDTHWGDKGLPETLSLRIALHAGPVYGCVDPVTGQANFTGIHVSRTARIEPITPPGQVFVSQPFAALAAAERVTEFACDYVGQTPLAKGYGTFPTYHLRRRAPEGAKGCRRGD